MQGENGVPTFLDQSFQNTFKATTLIAAHSISVIVQNKGVQSVEQFSERHILPA
jgi:hypothetical protein